MKRERVKLFFLSLVPNPDIEKIDITNHGNLERFF